MTNKTVAANWDSLASSLARSTCPTCIAPLLTWQEYWGAALQVCEEWWSYHSQGSPVSSKPSGASMRCLLWYAIFKFVSAFSMLQGGLSQLVVCPRSFPGMAAPSSSLGDWSAKNEKRFCNCRPAIEAKADNKSKNPWLSPKGKGPGFLSKTRWGSSGTPTSCTQTEPKVSGGI